jgi:hypothetical protein
VLASPLARRTGPRSVLPRHGKGGPGGAQTPRRLLKVVGGLSVPLSELVGIYERNRLALEPLRR